MTLRDKILIDLNQIKNPTLLNQVFEFIQLVKENYATSTESNKSEVMKFAGKISDKEAKEIITTIDSEFNKIEGDW